RRGAGARRAAVVLGRTGLTDHGPAPAHRRRGFRGRAAADVVLAHTHGERVGEILVDRLLARLLLDLHRLAVAVGDLGDRRRRTPGAPAHDRRGDVGHLERV